MTDSLRKAQQEYLERINDPSYVAPPILRGKRQNTSGYMDGLQQQAVLPTKKVYSNGVVSENLLQPETSSNAYQRSSNSDSAYMNELARSMGIEMKNNIPVLSDDDEVLMNRAIDKHELGVSVTPDEEKMLKLMVTGYGL